MCPCVSYVYADVLGGRDRTRHVPHRPHPGPHGSQHVHVVGGDGGGGEEGEVRSNRVGTDPNVLREIGPTL